MDVFKHRLNGASEGGGEGLWRQCDFERADIVPVGARHLGTGGCEVREFNQFIAASVAQENAEPFQAFRREDEDVCRANATERNRGPRGFGTIAG